MPLRRRRVGTRVRRKIRRIELWPALKIAFLFHLAAFAVTMVTLVVTWSLLSRAGFVDKISSFLVDIGFADGLTITGPVLARGAAFIGAALVVHNTVVTFLMVLLYNLFSSLFGGLIVSVIEEQLPRKPANDRLASKASPTPSPVLVPVPSPVPSPVSVPVAANEDRWLDELDDLDDVDP